MGIVKLVNMISERGEKKEKESIGNACKVTISCYSFDLLPF